MGKTPPKIPMTKKFIILYNFDLRKKLRFGSYWQNISDGLLIGT